MFRAEHGQLPDVRSLVVADEIRITFNDPPLSGSANWHNKNFEIRRPRDPARKRKWRVENKSTGESYDIVPGPNDGLASAQPDTPFGKGDVWILRYHGAELDDGSIATGPP